MNILIKFFSFAVLFFAAYVQSNSPTSPTFLKYFMWFCCGSVFTHFLLAILKTDEKNTDKKDEVTTSSHIEKPKCGVGENIT